MQQFVEVEKSEPGREPHASLWLMFQFVVMSGQCILQSVPNGMRLLQIEMPFKGDELYEHYGRGCLKALGPWLC